MRRNLLRQRYILRWSKLAAVMAQIPTHQDECIRVGRGASKTTDVADRMARRVQNIERPIAEKVVGSEVPDLKRAGLGERDFAKFSSSVV